MSRIGKKPLGIPKGVKVNISGDQVQVEGPKGKLSLPIPRRIAIENKDSKILVTRKVEDKQSFADHGTTWVLLSNIFKGVTDGYKKSLEIQGVGYRGQLQGKKLTLNLGFSHQVDFEVPASVQVKMPQPTLIELEGTDKAAVAEVAAKIRALKPPEPYKGKGIRYLGEFIKLKPGKAATK